MALVLGEAGIELKEQRLVIQESNMNQRQCEQLFGISEKFTQSRRDLDLLLARLFFRRLP